MIAAQTQDLRSEIEAKDKIICELSAAIAIGDEMIAALTARLEAKASKAKEPKATPAPKPETDPAPVATPYAEIGGEI